MKQGDYVVFKKGKYLKGAIGKVIMPPTEGYTGVRVRILYNPNETAFNHVNARIVADEDELITIESSVGQILDK